MTKSYSLNSNALLSIYSIIPVLLVVFLLDIYVFQGSLKMQLPERPEEWAWWLVIFNTPHIISSFITAANKKDIEEYGSTFLKVIVILIVASLLINGLFPSLITNEDKYAYQILVFAVYGFFTLHHVFSQQYGISLILGQSAPSKKMNIFKWLSILVAFVLFIHIGLGQRLVGYALEFIVTEIILSILVVMFGLNYFYESKTLKGKLYHLGNILLVLSSFLFVNMGYGIFALIVPRVIHDLSAFLIYANHDGNRYGLGNESHYIYRYFNKLSISPLYLSSFLGVITAYLINLINPITLVYLLLVIDFFHYYMERKIWKANTNHRKNLVLS